MFELGQLRGQLDRLVLLSLKLVDAVVELLLESVHGFVAHQHVTLLLLLQLLGGGGQLALQRRQLAAKLLGLLLQHPPSLLLLCNLLLSPNHGLLQLRHLALQLYSRSFCLHELILQLGHLLLRLGQFALNLHELAVQCAGVGSLSLQLNIYSLQCLVRLSAVVGGIHSEILRPCCHRGGLVLQLRHGGLEVHRLLSNLPDLLPPLLDKALALRERVSQLNVLGLLLLEAGLGTQKLRLEFLAGSIHLLFLLLKGFQLLLLLLGLTAHLCCQPLLAL
mmetsp:Transcript_31431/g.89236  ORF Transcript_31431/g.89236 Transcript_31431/m.89236 type:complete len:277 (+) Transcript_31431:740-1570(+)